jgi:hypothetical protein
MWNRERKRASRGLSEAQIVKATKGGEYTPSQAIQLLAGLGYSKGDAATLLLSNGIAITPPTTGPQIGDAQPAPTNG